VLIFDEVFVGFRLAPGGAQEYFGVRADMVTYGKTLGGGLPVGVVCGRSQWMKRFREDRPADICFARGTFNAHPYVMGAMNAFLERIEMPDVRALYDGLDERWNARAARFNAVLAEACLPVQVVNLSSIWTVLYTQPSRYNWMLQFYLRAHGLALSWVGSGRLIFSLNYSDADFEAVLQRFVAAAQAMQADGWWWRHADQPVDPPRHPARDAETTLLSDQRWCTCTIGSISSPRSRYSGDFQYILMSWKGSVRILLIQARPVSRSCSIHSWPTRNSRPDTPSASQAMPTSWIQPFTDVAGSIRPNSDGCSHSSSGSSTHTVSSAVLRRMLKPTLIASLCSSVAWLTWS